MPAIIVRLAASSPELQAGLDRIRTEFDVPTEFPEVVQRLAEAAATASRDLGERVDARDIELVTIDPPGSRDLDQAYCAERHDGGIRVRYAIADVAAFVQAGDPIDAEAHTRGVTVYMPDHRALLYPHVLGEGAASLLPDEERPALLWTIDLDADGAAKTWRLERALVRSRRALTYHQVQHAVDAGGADAPLMLLRDIGTLRQHQERARGGVNLGTPSQEIAPVRGGYELTYEAQLGAEAWNAQVSLLAGLCAATTMLSAGAGILRTLPPPDDHTIQRLRLTARTLGIPWADRASYADVVGSIASSTPGGTAFLTQAAHALRGAGYALVGATAGPPPVHSAIAAPYAHVTAPLRRLADRFANEVVVAACAEREPPAWAIDGLPALPDAMAAGARHAAAVERAVVDLAECLVLGAHVGEVLHGTVVDVGNHGATVLLPKPAVIASLDDSHVALGAEVDVRIVGTDLQRRRVEFRLA